MRCRWRFLETESQVEVQGECFAHGGLYTVCHRWKIIHFVEWRTWGGFPCRDTRQKILRVAYSTYVMVMALGFSNAATVQPIVFVERSVFYRCLLPGSFIHRLLAQG